MAPPEMFGERQLWPFGDTRKQPARLALSTLKGFAGFLEVRRGRQE